MGQSVSRGPAAPESAKTGGGINASGITPEQRQQTSPRELSPGPIRGAKDEFLPAAYEITHSIKNEEGKQEIVTMIREDH